jgi:hypothetical protein
MIMSPDKLILSLNDNLSPWLFIALRGKIYVLPTLFCFILPALVLSQNNKIDGLKIVWSSLYDRSGVEYDRSGGGCLNALSDCGASGGTNIISRV